MTVKELKEMLNLYRDDSEIEVVLNTGKYAGKQRCLWGHTTETDKHDVYFLGTSLTEETSVVVIPAKIKWNEIATDWFRNLLQQGGDCKELLFDSIYEAWWKGYRDAEFYKTKYIELLSECDLIDEFLKYQVKRRRTEMERN